jgi:hypothetical protein
VFLERSGETALGSLPPHRSRPPRVSPPTPARGERGRRRERSAVERGDSPLGISTSAKLHEGDRSASKLTRNPLRLSSPARAEAEKMRKWREW